MADFTLVSPGVLIREFDQTIRPANPVGTSAAVISRRQKGPAFEPVTVKDFDEDVEIFGAPSVSGDDFGAYCAQSYLKVEHRPLTQIRLLGRSDTGVTPGYTVPKTYALLASGSNVVALIQASGTVSLAGTLTSSAEELALNIQGLGDLTASLNPSSSKYIGKILNTDPSQLYTKNHNLFSVYDFADKTSPHDTYQIVELAGANAWTDDFLTASTPSIISQPFDSVEYDLFSIGLRHAGDSSNTLVKITITDIKKAVNESVYPYGTFTLLVRRYDDNDRAPVILESFSNLTLDPGSPNYVCRRIGDMYRVWNSGTKKFDEFGEYENKSKHIYIRPSLDLINENVPETALPFGFQGYASFTNDAFGGAASFPDFPMTQKLVFKNSFNTRVCWGVEVVNNQSGSINVGVADRAKHLPTAFSAASGSTGNKFSLKWLSASVGNVANFSENLRLNDAHIGLLSTSIGYQMNGEDSPVLSSSAGFSGYLSLENIENTPLAKFTLVAVDGFDALDVTKKNPLDPEDMVSDTTYQTLAVKTAIDMLANGDEIEISEVVIPGIWAPRVVEHAIDMVESRGDAFLIADISGSSVDDAIDSRNSANYDSSYAASFYPWLRFDDKINRKQVWVPPTVVVPAAFAFSDKISYPWFATAGMTRGSLKQHGALRAKDKLKSSERDKLYNNGINAIASFTHADGPVIWGQKTLQQQESALDRINVRRMMIHVRKLIAKIAVNFVFEPNVEATWDSFINKATPELENIQSNFGIDDFLLVLDERTTTEDLIERNIIYGKMAIRPTRTGEFFWLDFYLNNSIAGFAE